MFFIEKLSKNIVNKIYKNSIMDKDEIEIINYGALIFILQILSTFMVIVFGVIFGVFIESVLFFFCYLYIEKILRGSTFRLTN